MSPLLTPEALLRPGLSPAAKLLDLKARLPVPDGTSQVLLGGPWQPLTVAQRLTLQHQLDRVEFLARIGLRVSP